MSNNLLSKMRKHLYLFFLILIFFSNNIFCSEKNIDKNLKINIPENHNYYEITFKDLASNISSFNLNDKIFDALGMSSESKFLVISNNKNSINFFKDLTNDKGLNKLNKKYLEPIMQIGNDQRFIKIITQEIKKIYPNENLNNISEEKILLLIEQLFENSIFVKKINKLYQPIIDKFEKEYSLQNYTIIFLGDKKIKNIDQIKKRNINELTKIVKNSLADIYFKTKDPTLKSLSDYKFIVNMNEKGDLFLYSDDVLKNQFYNKKYYQELYVTTFNDRLFFSISICVDNCNKTTELANILKPSNIYLSIKQNLDINSKNNINPKNKASISSQLIKLNELFKSGVLTKDEFEKAKKRILE